MAVEHFHTLPNRLIYGDQYVVQGHWEIEEVIAFLEIRDDQRKAREEERHRGKPLY